MKTALLEAEYEDTKNVGEDELRGLVTVELIALKWGLYLSYLYYAYNNNNICIACVVVYFMAAQPDIR